MKDLTNAPSLDRNCWYEKEKRCSCVEDIDCVMLRVKHAKLVWCSDYECAHNINVPVKKPVIFNKRNYTPFPGDFFKGVCGRVDELMLRQHHIVESGVKDKVTKCICRTDKRITGHMDFSRFIGQGGNIPDANDPAAGYYASEMADPDYWHNEYRKELEQRD